VDPVSNLGLSADSVYAYHVGEITRVLSEGLPITPELLPYGYLIGEEISIKVCIKSAQHCGSVDAMAFETLIPKSIVQR
jgi:neuron navigator 2